jgi:hypothetical protein
MVHEVVLVNMALLFDFAVDLFVRIRDHVEHPKVVVLFGNDVEIVSFLSCKLDEAELVVVLDALALT